MKRVHLFEFTDLPWYPQTFRRIQTDYLKFVATRGSEHKNLVSLLIKGLQHAGTQEIVDLCSGGTGPWLRLLEQFQKAGFPVKVTLTDKYPHPEAAHIWNGRPDRCITYLSDPVEATHIPTHLKGMRTLFEGFHHFKPAQARAILQDAVEKRAAIGIFETSFKPPFEFILLLLSPLMTFLAYWLITPFIKPRTWSRFFWTYLAPIVPLATCWDGMVSLLRVYSTEELRELSLPFEGCGYIWEIGQASTGTPIFNFIYLLAYPQGNSKESMPYD